VGSYPVAGVCHFTGDGGVAGFVGGDEAGAGEAEEKEEEAGGDGEEEEAGHGKFGGWRAFRPALRKCPEMGMGLF